MYDQERLELLQDIAKAARAAEKSGWIQIWDDGDGWTDQNDTDETIKLSSLLD